MSCNRPIAAAALGNSPGHKSATVPCQYSYLTTGPYHLCFLTIRIFQSANAVRGFVAMSMWGTIKGTQNHAHGKRVDKEAEGTVIITLHYKDTPRRRNRVAAGYVMAVLQTLASLARAPPAARGK